MENTNDPVYLVNMCKMVKGASEKMIRLVMSLPDVYSDMLLKKDETSITRYYDTKKSIQTGLDLFQEDVLNLSYAEAKKLEYAKNNFKFIIDTYENHKKLDDNLARNYSSFDKNMNLIANYIIRNIIIELMSNEKSSDKIEALRENFENVMYRIQDIEEYFSGKCVSHEEMTGSQRLDTITKLTNLADKYEEEYKKIIQLTFNVLPSAFKYTLLFEYDISENNNEKLEAKEKYLDVKNDIQKILDFYKEAVKDLSENEDDSVEIAQKSFKNIISSLEIYYGNNEELQKYCSLFEKNLLLIKDYLTIDILLRCININTNVEWRATLQQDLDGFQQEIKLTEKRLKDIAN